MVDYTEVDAKNRALGRAGECLVLHYQRETLRRKGRPDLAQRVRHVAAIEGDGAGYDMLSFSEDGTVKYIEVKTTVRVGVAPISASSVPRRGLLTLTSA
jgi:hypothetical protein